MMNEDETEFWNELGDMSRRELSIMACLSLRKLLDLDSSQQVSLEHNGVNVSVMAATGKPLRGAFQKFQEVLVIHGGATGVKVKTREV